MDEVRKILNDLVQDCQDMDSHIETVNLSIAQALLAIDKLYKEKFLRIIGKDEDTWGGTYADVQIRIGRNSMRQEIREKINGNK